jgi:hypothetical protein
MTASDGTRRLLTCRECGAPFLTLDLPDERAAILKAARQCDDVLSVRDSIGRRGLEILGIVPSPLLEFMWKHRLHVASILLHDDGRIYNLLDEECCPECFRELESVFYTNPPPCQERHARPRAT